MSIPKDVIKARKREQDLIQQARQGVHNCWNDTHNPIYIPKRKKKK